MSLHAEFIVSCDLVDEPVPNPDHACYDSWVDPHLYGPGYSLSWWEKVVVIRQEGWFKTRRDGKSVIGCPNHKKNMSTRDKAKSRMHHATAVPITELPLEERPFKVDLD